MTPAERAAHAERMAAKKEEDRRRKEAEKEARAAETARLRELRREEKKRAGVSGQGRCFNCGASGHLSGECPEAKREGKGC